MEATKERESRLAQRTLVIGALSDDSGFEPTEEQKSAALQWQLVRALRAVSRQTASLKGYAGMSVCQCGREPHLFDSGRE